MSHQTTEIKTIKNNKIMKTYTFVYNTKSMKNVEYSFKAESMSDAEKFVNGKFNDEILNNGQIVENGYEVEVHYRTGRVVTKNYNGARIQEWESKTDVVWVKNADELLDIYVPTSKSEGLVSAVNSFFEGKRDKVEYNFGKGNALFILNK